MKRRPVRLKSGGWILRVPSGSYWARTRAGLWLAVLRHRLGHLFRGDGFTD